MYVPSDGPGPLRQGEILSNLVETHIAVEAMGAAESLIDQIIHPFAIVVSQDCDLEWDFEARQGVAQEHKQMPNVLLCMVQTAEELRGRENMNSGLWRPIPRNNNKRYHFLQQVEAAMDATEEGLPELVVDFKRYFSVPPDEIYMRIDAGEVRRRCRLVSPYLEHLSTRFAYYQFRVALPEPHRSE